MFSMSRRQWTARFASLFTVGARSPQPKRERKKAATWELRLPSGVVFRETAHTAGEARGPLKRTLGLERLPIGTVVRKLDQDSTEAA